MRIMGAAGKGTWFVVPVSPIRNPNQDVTTEAVDCWMQV